eukprot:CAMPEP_0114242744 /NCGR_PEP_ID=MMETSP0058-20121206/10353_1 /TAXON_ID=36894 /ORGANISM="Pyramimonas parkeae, CCMP726" /LENGTH=90 /DNA_ID=CAMNT_0001355405 /DNA_START=312 /DNA_END=584 /DNA_ORIENTATION=+
MAYCVCEVCSFSNAALKPVNRSFTSCLSRSFIGPLAASSPGVAPAVVRNPNTFTKDAVPYSWEHLVTMCSWRCAHSSPSNDNISSDRRTD